MKKDMTTLPMIFNTLHKKMMEKHHDILNSYNLSKVHMPYLLIISDHQEGITQKAMTNVLFMDKAHASRALKDLLNKAMINKDDETVYKNKYYLTDLGKKVVEDIRTSSMKMREKIILALTPEEIDAFRKLSEKLVSVIDTLD